jgi:hypothetical protein
LADLIQVTESRKPELQRFIREIVLRGSKARKILMKGGERGKRVKEGSVKDDRISCYPAIRRSIYLSEGKH